jgi:hypothetical protein
MAASGAKRTQRNTGIASFGLNIRNHRHLEALIAAMLRPAISNYAQ